MGIANLYEQLERWYASRAGQESLALIREHLAHLQENLSGQHALFCGPEALFHEVAPTRHRFDHRFFMHPGASRTQVRGQPEALPFASNCLDLLALAHPLELSDQPHGVLREADRVLVGNGHLLLVGFNPWSWYGLYRLLAVGRFPWDRHFYGVRRVKDWLSVLNFRVRDCRYAAFRPPIQSQFLQKRTSALEIQARWRLDHLGGVYCILARKLRVPVTPVRERWYRPAVFIPERLAEVEPTSRGIDA